MSKPTLQYTEVPAQPLVPAPEPTAVSAQLSYEDAKPFLSGKPLRRPSRSRVLSQDHADVAEAMRRLAAETPVDYFEARKELGLE